MNNLDEEIKKNVINKLEEIRVCGDKAELWNFEAGRTLTLIKKQDKELETYKKIAEKLAEEISYTDNLICKYLDAIDKCKYEARKDNTNTCKQCIIDWARKEVEK